MEEKQNMLHKRKFQKVHNKHPSHRELYSDFEVHMAHICGHMRAHSLSLSLSHIPQ